MTPLSVTAHMRGPVCLPNGPIALDALLASAVCTRDGLEPALTASECTPIGIPVAMEPGGRFHLASVSHGAFEEREGRWVNRRFPVPEAQAMGDARLRRIQITAGACKSYRLPLEVQHLAGDVLRWWCLGDVDVIRQLLDLVGYVGKKRSVGLGRVVRWDVSECEAWDGFPVLRDGYPLRPLPVDWPGLSVSAERAYRVMTYPYWRRSMEELCAVP